jgi:hypothetical protein
MMTDRQQAGKQPARQYPRPGGAPPAVMAEMPLDPRLAQTPGPFGGELVDQILAGHGPHRPGGAACKGCGFTYHAEAQDCPSVLYALSNLRHSVGTRVPLRGEF